MRALARHCAKRQAARSAAPPRSGGWVEIPQCTAGGWRSAWARGITREHIPSDFGRAERDSEAEREIQGKHFIGLSECTKNVVGTTKAVHEFCRALKRGAKATLPVRQGSDSARAPGGRPRPANVRRASPFDRKNSVLPESLGPYVTSVPYGKNVYGLVWGGG